MASGLVLFCTGATGGRSRWQAIDKPPPIGFS